MKLSTPWKTVIGILTVLQLFAGLFIAIWFFTQFIPVLPQLSEDAAEEFVLVTMGSFIVAIIALSFVGLGILVFYLIHAGTNKHISGVMKAVWIIMILIFGSVAEVIYFFMEIVPEKSMTARLEDEP